MIRTAVSFWLAVWLACISDGPVDPPPTASHRAEAHASAKLDAVSFMGLQDKATSVVFVLDGSGSMAPKFRVLQGQLKRAVDTLLPSQSFDVVLTRIVGLTALSVHLVPATDENQRKCDSFLLGVVPDGPTDPIPALEAAFAARPDVVFFVGDGDFPDNALVLNRMRDLNRECKARINTIAFQAAADKDTEFKRVLRDIANESGGQFKEAAPEDFRPR